jgi:pimeloyl-ACP methyl ester carboxylesterase
MARQSFINTSHGTLAVEEHGHGDTPVVLIHGNSSCRVVFRHQLEAPFAQRYRMIAFDLPGHGQSGNASHPHKAYTLPGLAEAILELLDALNVSEPIVFGWSLGGHIAIELLARYPRMRALLLSGAPPVGRSNGANNIAQGFNISPRGNIAGKEIWSVQDAQSFIHGIFGASDESFLVEPAKRADSRFRKRLFESSREGIGIDQRQTIESAWLPIAVMNGAEDFLIKLDYFDTVNFKNLWNGKAYRLPGLVRPCSVLARPGGFQCIVREIPI